MAFHSKCQKAYSYFTAATLGSISNIDVARIALGIDYRAKTIKTSEYDSKPMWLLALESNSNQFLYDKVKLWID